MGFITWIKSFFTNGAVSFSGSDLDAYVEEYASAYSNVCIREMAFWSSINLISNAVAKCEFKTFDKGVEVKNKEYYLWNIEPNRNQNASAFIQRFLSKLYRNNEALIIDQNGQLLVADSFTRRKYALFDDVFADVKVGDMEFGKIFYQSDVMYFELNEVNMQKLVNGIYESYDKLINYTMAAYQKSRGTKGIFKYKTLPVSGTAQREAFDSLINEKIGKWLKSDNAALALGEGQDWQELGTKSYSNDTTRDIRSMIDDISDFTAKAFGIPPALLRGDVAGLNDAMDEFLTFCIDPLIDMLEQEINRKRNGRAAFLEGTYLKIDTKQIKHVDLLSVATAIDKLISSGVFCINDIRKLVGEQPLDDAIANKHYITKNYMPIDEALTEAGGE